MAEKQIAWFRDRLELLMVLLTMVGMFVTGVWWTSKLDSRVTSLEEWRSEARPVVARMDVMELRIQRQYELLQKIDGTLCEMQQSMWKHLGRDANGIYDKSKVGVQ